MSTPKIELIPGRPVVCADASITLNVLIRITSPQPEVHFPRPPLNLALVLDRSGSMDGANKMPFAREAAAFVVTQLLPTDRVSVTIFDDRVETIVANTLAVDKHAILRMIERIVPRGSTDLHGGWQAGASEAESNRVAGGVNRVLLLSDGQANVGVTDANALSQASREQAARGVSTTTLGVGNNYNEDLMESMAKAGDGNYYYIESPRQLVDLFQTELQGLMATTGHAVSLGLEPTDGVTVVDVLNDFDKVPTGRFQLPNLVIGMPLLVVVKLNVPPQSAMVSPLAIRLAYNVPRSAERNVIHARLDAMYPVPLEAWNRCAVDPEAAEAEALLMVARAQKEASRSLERGDFETSLNWVVVARSHAQSVPASDSTMSELAAIDEIEVALHRRDDLHMRKLAKYRAYGRSRNRPEAPTEPDTTDKKL